jgi:simple sugar transport system ATP-binding protein
MSASAEHEIPAASLRAPLLEVAGLTKTFGGLKAIDSVDLEVRPGEVIGLVGDNGAGKSTLVRCIAGVYAPDEGEIRVEGQPVQTHKTHSPKQAAEAGIEVVHQDLSLIPHGDVAENLFLNRELRSPWPVLRQIGWLDKAAMRRRAREILTEVGIGGIVSVRQRIGELSGGQRQCVAIGRAVGWKRRIVFLDEPTAALGVRQTAIVLDLIRRLRDRGIAVVLISHNMEQVLDVCDRVVVMRLGRKVADRPVAELDGSMLVSYITGVTKNG